MRGGRESPEWTRPLAGVGAIAMVLLSLSNVMANQFGFDRDGFRVFVLSSVRRREKASSSACAAASASAKAPRT